MLRKLGKDESGFTLIELMVVVLIIAILVAIAIPSFVGMRNRGYDAQAKSNLRNGVTSAQTYFTDNETYLTMGAAALQVIEPNITFVDKAGLAVAGDTVRAVYNDTGARALDAARLSVLSQSGSVFIATKAANSGWSYNF